MPKETKPELPILEETKYGFRWKGVEISRVMSDEKKGWRVLQLKTPKHKGQGMQIYVTKTGKVRIYGEDNREWKPSLLDTDVPT